MAEYFGITESTYKVDANPIIDFSAVSKAITDGLKKNEQERERQRKEDLKITQDNIAEIENLNYGSDQDMNQIMTKYGYNVKDTMNGWYKELTNGRMSRREFALSSQNLLNGTKSVANASKGFNETNQKYIDLLNSGDASAMSQYTAKKIADAQMLNNKSMFIDPNSGTVNWVAVDQNNKIIPGSASDIKTILNLKNNLEKKVNVPEEVQKLAGSKIEDFKKAYGAYLNINDPKIRGEYNLLVQSTSDYILSTPSRSADVLVNFTGKGYYLTDDANDANPLAIKVVKDNNGMVIPKPTDAQMQDAKDAIKRSIDSQMPYEEEKKAPNITRGGGGSGGGGKKDEGPVMTIGDRVNYDTKIGVTTKKVGNKVVETSTSTKKGSQYAINSEPLKVAGSSFTEQPIAIGQDGAGNRYITIIKRSGSDTEGETVYGEQGEVLSKGTTGKTRKTERTVRVYETSRGGIKLGQNDSVRASDYQRLKAKIEQETGQDFDEIYPAPAAQKKPATSKKQSDLPKATSQEDFNSKWSKLKPGEKLVGPDGNTYTKAK